MTRTMTRGIEGTELVGAAVAPMDGRGNPVARK